MRTVFYLSFIQCVSFLRLRHSVVEGIMFSVCPSAAFVRSFVLPDRLLPRYERFESSFDKTYSEYSLAPILMT